MKLQRSNKLLSGAICLLAVVYSASSQCCDFSLAACSWSGIWLTSPDYTPNTVSYPGFWSTVPDDHFKFIQDQSASETSDATFHISSPGTVISFDFFFDSPYTSSGSYLEFYFKPAGGTPIFIYGTATPYPNWQFQRITCDSSNKYCCGSLADVPCDGYITVTSTVGTVDRDALFAFDHIGIC
ncbi:hypothetical protein CHUAL_008323 [Chamberlinius hualienensis]